ncbi:MAG: NAD(P)/FAD-dependent oxidoreductase [Bacteroidota bacterium]
MEAKNKDVVIAGSGLVGSLLSIFLAKKGYKVKVFERRPDLRSTNSYQGRSINLALSDRGWRALKKIGIDQDIKKIAIPMYSRMIHDVKGNLVVQPYGKNDQAIYSVSRLGINVALLELADKLPNIELLFDERCESIDFEKKEANFVNAITDRRTKENASLIFSADGAFSAGRLSKQLSSDRFEYQQFYINCAYKELAIPAGENGSFLMEKNALHIWPRGSFMMIALPNPDGSFTCTLFFPASGEFSFEELNTREKTKTFFEKYFNDALPLMPDYLDQFERNPVSSLVTVKCFPWIYKDSFSLIGDAAHAIVPFFGQGMNCGFEDCVVLDELMEEYQEKWDEILPEFEKLRKPDADAIADLAINNFNEMSDKTGDPKFLLQKKIEANFSDKHPDKWIPAYSMVTFSPHIRYSEALANGKRQQGIMDDVMNTENIENIWDSEQIEKMILERI